MPRLLVHVEGQTEETFVNEVLAEHLRAFGYHDVRARLAGNPRKQRGGIRPWGGFKRDILAHLKEDRAAINAVMVDYYALPHDWPGRAEASSKNSSSAKAEYVESALNADIIEAMGLRFAPNRFVPLVVMHEFEALLFSDPERFASGIEQPDLAAEFHAIRHECGGCPEDINDSADTAPSKRIMKLFPRYQKPLFGPLAVMEIGLSTIRKECPHFSRWLERLESLVE
jgi:hypothetical protein